MSIMSDRAKIIRKERLDFLAKSLMNNEDSYTEFWCAQYRIPLEDVIEHTLETLPRIESGEAQPGDIIIIIDEEESDDGEEGEEDEDSDDSESDN